MLSSIAKRASRLILRVPSVRAAKIGHHAPITLREASHIYKKHATANASFRKTRIKPLTEVLANRQASGLYAIRGNRFGSRGMA